MNRRTGRGQTITTVDTIRNLRGPAFLKLRRIAEAVDWDLTQAGFFCWTPEGDVYYFFQPELRLLALPSDHFAAFLENRCGLNPVEHEAKFTVKHLQSRALEHGRRTQVYRLAYFNRETSQLYVHNLGQQVYRLDGASIEVVPNGTDDILFVSDPWHEPFECGEPADFLAPLLVERANFDTSSGRLGTGDYRALFTIWLVSLFFENLLPTKPIATFVGPQGSGKSSLVRLIGILLFGSRFNVSPLRADKEDAFDAAIANSYYVAFDNADTRVRWLEDKLAVAATGQAITLRKLYTTNEQAVYWPRCFLALTSREPQFRRPDVADRLILFPLARLQSFTPETALIQDILSNRGALWAELLQALNQVVAALQAASRSRSHSYRMADWADLASIIAETVGMGDRIHRLLHGMAEAQVAFALEDDPLATGLMSWLANPANNGRWLTAHELLNELWPGPQERNKHCPYANAYAVAKHLTNILPQLEQVCEVARTPGQGGILRYSFKLKAAESKTSIP